MVERRIHCPSGCDDDYVQLDEVMHGISSTTYYTCYKCEWSAYYQHRRRQLVTVSEPINSAPLQHPLRREYGHHNMFGEGEDKG